MTTSIFQNPGCAHGFRGEVLSFFLADHMLIQGQPSMQTGLCHIPKISQRFASELRSGPWCCDLVKKRTVQCPSSNL